MNNREINQNNMFKKVAAYLNLATVTAIIAGFARLVKEVANFNKLNTTLNGYITAQQQTSTGITEQRNAYFDALVTLIVKAASKAHVWASDNNDEKLKAIFNAPESDFYSMPEQEAFAKIQLIRNTLNTNIGSITPDYNLSAIDVTAIDTAITNYQSHIGETGTAIGGHKASTQEIKDTIKSINTSLKTMDKLIPSEYSDTNHDFVLNYQNARIIDDIGTHHNAIELTITDAATGNPVQGAIFSITGTTKTATSNIDGIAQIIGIKANKYNTTVTATGYQAQTPVITIIKSKTIEQDVKLTKA